MIEVYKINNKIKFKSTDKEYIAEIIGNEIFSKKCEINKCKKEISEINQEIKYCKTFIGYTYNQKAVMKFLEELVGNLLGEIEVYENTISILEFEIKALSQEAFRITGEKKLVFISSNYLCYYIIYFILFNMEFMASHMFIIRNI